MPDTLSFELEEPDLTCLSHKQHKLACVEAPDDGSPALKTLAIMRDQQCGVSKQTCELRTRAPFCVS